MVCAFVLLPAKVVNLTYFATVTHTQMDIRAGLGEGKNKTILPCLPGVCMYVCINMFKLHFFSVRVEGSLSLEFTDLRIKKANPSVAG